jgi:hypothetical protein
MIHKSETNTVKERVAALRKGLQEAGFVEGTNYSLAVRFPEGDFNRLPQLARELGALNPRVFVTVGFGAAPAQRSSFLPAFGARFTTKALRFWKT